MTSRNKTINQDNSKALFASALFAVIGFILLVTGIYFYYSDSALLREWKSAKGQITNSALKQLAQLRGVSYVADVNYTYQYNGKQYGGTCCSYGSGDYDRWNSVVTKNSVNSSADILIDPSNPSNSVLIDSIQPLNWLNTTLIIAGAIGMLIGAYSTYIVSKE